MERVAFLVEETGERLRALLNPETVSVRRVAGLRNRGGSVGQLTGKGLSDEPLLFTGGGRTEIELDLLFDTSLAGSSIHSEDVRDLTRPLWELSENQSGNHGYGKPPLVRFVWGKTWNIPAVVAAVAERLERFSAGGAPSRSFLRMRLFRTGEMSQDTSDEPTERELPPLAFEQLASESGFEFRFHPMIGGGLGIGERLDELANRYYGDSSLWRLIASANGLVDPLRIELSSTLRIPSLGSIGTGL